MKTFNKTLLAALVASASAGAFAAGEKVTDATSSWTGCVEDGVAQCSSVAFEGISLGNNVITHSGVNFEADGSVTGMNAIDRILIEVNGAQFTLDADTIFNSGVMKSDGSTSQTVAATVTPQLQSLNALAVDFNNPEDFSSFDTIQLRNLKLDVDGAALGDTVTVTVKAQKLLGVNNYTTVSQATGTVAQVVNQLGLGTDNYGDFAGGSYETVNATNRLSFVSSTPYETSATASVTDKAVNYAGVDAISGGEYSLLVEGDFSFLDADGDGEIDSGNSITVDSGAELEISEDFQSFVIKGSAADINADGTSLSSSIDIEVDGERELPELSATGTVSFGYATTTGSTTLGGGVFDQGTTLFDWNLQGVATEFSYMPYGDSISQILFVTNNGNNDARITVYGWDEAGTMYGPVTLDKAATARGVTKITGEVKDAMLAEGFSGKGPLKLRIVVNSSNVDVYGAYNVGGTDRGYVPAQ